ncbi:uncharacterized protein LOC141685191 [Apium graveolens]|uniref:uncharacterized protein LOC141685191 n=1 Tax=Apium graveolens TaxID=4045 RepID=UPI003D792E65
MAIRREIVALQIALVTISFVLVNLSACTFHLSTAHVKQQLLKVMADSSTTHTNQVNQTNQDPSSIYYIHPSDSCTNQLVSVKFIGEGFNNWKRSMMLTLSAKNKLGFVNGTISIPEDVSSDEYKAWQRCNDLVISWILFNLDENIARSVLFLKTSRAIWRDLEERFGYASMPQISSLEQKLSELHQGQLTVSEFYTKLKTLWDSLDDAYPLPTCTCEKCSFVRGNILMMTPMLNVTQAYSIERCFKIHGFPPGFKPRERKIAAFSQNANMSDQSPNHTDDQLVSNSNSVSTSVSTSVPPISMDQHNHLIELLGKQKFIDRDQDIQNHNGHALLAAETNSFITIPDGSKIRVTHVGIVILNDKITLTNVLLVPTFNYRLMSVRKLCQDMHSNVIFSATQCHLQDPSRKNPPLLLGEIHTGLYTVTPQHVVSAPQFFQSSAAYLSISDDSKLWHLRLGHVPFSNLKLIHPTYKVQEDATDSLCQICPKAKQTRNSFPISSIKSSAIFELLHVDVWGPYKVKNHNNCNQFVTIVDDYSRYTWVHLVRYKSEVPIVLSKFIAYAENQFCCKVLAIHSDNAKEFTEGFLKSFL